MLKKLLLAITALIVTMGFAFAQVDVNKADQAALDGVKGIGPAISKKIIDERKKGGDFKDWADFETRVKGVGAKNSIKLSQAGLVVNGQAKANAPAAAKEEKPAKDAKAKDKNVEKTVAPSAVAPAASASASVTKEDKKLTKEEKKAAKEEKKKNKKADKASASASAATPDKK